MASYLYLRFEAVFRRLSRKNGVVLDRRSRPSETTPASDGPFPCWCQGFWCCKRIYSSGGPLFWLVGWMISIINSDGKMGAFGAKDVYLHSSDLTHHILWLYPLRQWPPHTSAVKNLTKDPLLTQLYLYSKTVNVHHQERGLLKRFSENDITITAPWILDYPDDLSTQRGF